MLKAVENMQLHISVYGDAILLCYNDGILKAGESQDNGPDCPAQEIPI